jgi:hypothetical protein
MHAYGRTLRQAGDLRLLALPVGSGAERYCVLDGPTPLATFDALEPAAACFDAARAARAAGECGGCSLPDPGAGLADLDAFRRRRGRRSQESDAGERE